MQEFNSLLSTQLDAQRRYYEDVVKVIQMGNDDLLASVESAKSAVEDKEAELAASVAEADLIKVQIAEAEEKTVDLQKQKAMLEKLNTRLASEKETSKPTVDTKAEKRARAALIDDLKQQVRDLTFAVEAKAKIRGKMSSEDVEQSFSVMTTSAKPSRKKGKKS